MSLLLRTPFPPLPRPVAGATARLWARRPSLPWTGASTRIIGWIRHWPVESQQGARRNAMVACTAAAARRAEHDAVRDYLVAHAAARAAAGDAAAGRG